MGCDGGTIPKRQELVKEKKKAQQVDTFEQQVQRWFYCAVSNKQLHHIIASDDLGNLFDYEEILEFLAYKRKQSDDFPHIASKRDLHELKTTPNPDYSSGTFQASTGAHRLPKSPFICPYTFKEMNGTARFVFNTKCSCLVSEAAAESSNWKTCPRCDWDVKKEDYIYINPTAEEYQRQKVRMDMLKPAKKPKKKKRTHSIDATSSDENDRVSSDVSAIIKKYKTETVLTPAMQAIYTTGEPQTSSLFSGTFTRYAA